MQVGSHPFGWGPVDEADARSAIRKALELGINFFDTADVYGLGRSEELLGEELKGRDAVIATKAGKIRSEEGENRRISRTIRHRSRRKEPETPPARHD